MTRKSAKVAKALAKRDAAKTPRKAVPNPTEQPKAPLRRQPADREGLRRCAGAGLHRGNAELDAQDRLWHFCDITK